MSFLASATTVGNVFRHWSQAAPQKRAVHCPDGLFRTFAQLNENINRITNRLQELGLKHGDRVAIYSRNSIEYLETFGLSKAGIVVVPLNWRLQPDELVRLIEHSESVAVLVEDHFSSVGDELQSKAQGVKHWIFIGQGKPGWQRYEDLLQDGSANEVEATIAGKDPLCLIYTSGTTGLPKGVSITHEGALCNARVAADEMLQLVHEDTTMVVMPMFHVGGMWYPVCLAKRLQVAPGKSVADQARAAKSSL